MDSTPSQTDSVCLKVLFVFDDAEFDGDTVGSDIVQLPCWLPLSSNELTLEILINIEEQHFKELAFIKGYSGLHKYSIYVAAGTIRSPTVWIYFMYQYHQ